MPFDGLQDYRDEHDTAVDTRFRLLESLLAKPDRWCKGRRSMSRGWFRSRRYCLSGAMLAATANEDRSVSLGIHLRLCHAIRDLFPNRPWEVVLFNDHEDTTHADVLAVVRHAGSPERRSWFHSDAAV